MVKFVSYDGEFPNLCRGTLVIEVDGEEWRLRRVLRSKMGCGFGGGWSLRSLPDELEPYREEIKRCVNDNVEHGCCGGCL
nr:MAG TPA: hypothetical protein [Caudoviricetes sp.]